MKFEPASDTVQTPKKTARERAGDMIKSIFPGESIESDDQPKKVPPKKGKSAKQGYCLSKFPLVAGLLMGGLAWAWPELAEPFEVDGETRTLLPNEYYQAEIIQPLLRIADRHMHLEEVSPDTADLTDSIMAIVAYSIETRTLLIQVRRMRKPAEKTQEAARDHAGQAVITSRGPEVFG